MAVEVLPQTHQRSSQCSSNPLAGSTEKVPENVEKGGEKQLERKWMYGERCCKGSRGINAPAYIQVHISSKQQRH